ncbi:MAG: hypothetical protein KGL39_22790 [Patescibacteria group bacterium]|nr:hypothetical protein [Patescibacteria group bacterium]
MKIEIQTNEGKKEVTAYPVKFRGWLANYRFAVHRKINNKSQWRVTETSSGFGISGIIETGRTKKSAIKIARKRLIEAGPKKLDKAIKEAKEIARDLAARKP